MSQRKDQLRTDLTTSMKARDELRTATLRMALAAVLNAEVAGKEASELSDDQVLVVLAREVKTRHESAVTYADAGRPELAERERAEAEILESYLPRQLDDAAVRDLVAAAIAESGATGRRDMGKAMGAAKKAAGAEVDGRRLSAEVGAQLDALG